MLRGERIFALPVVAAVLVTLLLGLPANQAEAACVSCQMYDGLALCVSDSFSPWGTCRARLVCRDRCIMFQGHCVMVPFCWEACDMGGFCTRPV